MGKDDLFKKRQKNGLKQRRAEIQKERESLWVICEGKSEQNYLESLYPKKFRFCFSKGLSAIKSKIAEESEVKHIFVLLDGDIHRDADIINFRDYCKSYSNATVIVNSPCFEYWLILHFEYTTRSFVGNNQGKTKDNECEKYLKKILNKHSLTYKKGEIEANLLEKLKELQSQAIAKAKKTSNDKEKSDVGSYSEMYKLFEVLETL